MRGCGPGGVSTGGALSASGAASTPSSVVHDTGMSTALRVVVETPLTTASKLHHALRCYRHREAITSRGAGGKT